MGSSKQRNKKGGFETMNKNLKKVISAVAALSLSASSIAAFAAGFPDVEETASYAQAVQELSALNVISGYDDGTFKPDNLVTRAEISKMIVDALAEGNEAAASSNASKFADVSNAGTDGHWATGYINQGVTDGWIAGYDDNSFGPDDNVTYVQAQKMLVAAIGYETYANAKGGWPSGYKQYASSLGITSGVQGVSSDDQQLTRAQVAQMIDNAMDAPLCVIDGNDYDAWGNLLPKLEVKDETGKDYQTLFTNAHDAYKVYGRVTETSKTTGSSIDNDKVKFRVEKADNFDDEYVKSTDSKTYIEEDMYFGDTDAENMVRTYAQALIQKNDDDEYVILSITAAAANKSVELNTDDYDADKSTVSASTGTLYFYPAGTTRNSVKYELDSSVSIYVNGKSYSGNLDTAIATYVDGNTTGTVTLQKETNAGSTSSSSKYNVIMITSYATAVVDQVIDKTDTTSINFKSGYSSNAKATLKVYKDDDQYTYSFTLNGEEIDPADLQEFDVLTIKADPTDFGGSTFYEVQVSRDTTEGKYSGKSGDSYKFDGTSYDVANGITFSTNFDSSTEYALYLDVFGNLAYVDEQSNTKKVGILKSVYRKSNGDYIAEIIDKDAQLQEYTIDFNEENNSSFIGAEYIATKNNGTAVDGSTYASGLGTKAENLAQQVVEYKVSSSNKVTIKKTDNTNADTGFEKSRAVANTTDGDEYKASTDKIGSIRISDNTTIIDLSNYDKKKDSYSVASKDSLKDGKYYVAYAYDYSKTDSTYRYVVLVKGSNTYDSTSQLAVFVEYGTENVDGDDLTSVTLLYNNEKQTLYVDSDATSTETAIKALSEGDPIVFNTNTSGYIDDVKTVFNASGKLTGKFNEFRTAVAYDVASLLNTTDLSLDGNNLSSVLKDSDEDVYVQAGIIVKSGNSYALAKTVKSEQATENGQTVTKYYVELDDAQDLAISSSTVVYTYNFSKSTKNNARLVLDEGIAYTPDVNDAYADKANSDKYYISHNDVQDDVVFAVVRTHDKDEVQEIYQFVAE
jgi:hypothetical protein